MSDIASSFVCPKCGLDGAHFQGERPVALLALHEMEESDAFSAHECSLIYAARILLESALTSHFQTIRPLTLVDMSPRLK